VSLGWQSHQFAKRPVYFRKSQVDRLGRGHCELGKRGTKPQMVSHGRAVQQVDRNMNDRGKEETQMNLEAQFMNDIRDLAQANMQFVAENCQSLRLALYRQAHGTAGKGTSSTRTSVVVCARMLPLSLICIAIDSSTPGDGGTRRSFKSIMPSARVQ